MKRAFLAAFLTASVAGCALIIDLGDEPKLAPSDGGVVLGDTGTSGGPTDALTETSLPADTGTDSSSPPVFECGLPPSTNVECSSCIKQNCCDISKACAANPKCVQGLDCIKHCLVQPNCVNKCLFDFPEVNDEATCSAFQCSKCTPGPECAKLGKCVFDLPQDSILRLAQEGRILNLDDAVCKSARLQVASDGTADAGACFDP